jgi:hypothetical protein
MDGSKPFGTVHGERAPGDPHQHVHYYQDGLPFDAGRLLLAEMIEGDERLTALAAKKLARQAKQPVTVAAASIDGDDGDNPQDIDDDETAEDDTNLEMWLTGEAKYIFANVRNAIAARYQKRVISIADAVMFLVGEQKVVPADKLAPQYRTFID